MKILWAILFPPFLLGCVAAQKAVPSSPRVVAQPTIERSASERPANILTPRIMTTIVGWGDPNTIRTLTIEEIRSSKILCVYIIRPEYRQNSMKLLFMLHRQITGEPYLTTIAENWMQTFRGTIFMGKTMLIPTCESAWEHGDLNADGRVDYEDFSIYARTQ